MRFITKIWFVLVAGALLPCAAWAASFTASLDRAMMTLGDQATLSLKFDGVQPQDAPAMPNIPGLQFQYVGPSSAFSFINGQTSASVTFNYMVTAQRDGVFNIPAMRTTMNGQMLSSLPLRLVVNKAAAPSTADEAAGKDPAFLKLSFPKTKVYVGEPVIGQLELYLREDVQGLNGFQLTSSPTDGFTAGKTTEEQGMRRREQIGNHAYTVIPLMEPLTAIRAGSLTLGPFTATAVIALPSQNQSGNPFEQMFNRGEQRQVTLATQPFNVEALPLPDQNKPADFNGAIGNFTMAATAGPTTVTVGDPITVRVQISGHGAFDSVTLPPQDAWRDFKTYPPTTKLETSDQFGFQGTKTFEQIISPQNSDMHSLPALTFSFFNPDDNQYHTLTQPAVPLVVKTTGATPAPTLAVSKNAAAENQAPQDIAPIKEQPGTLLQNTTPLIAQPVFLATQSLPVLAFLAAFIWRKRADNLANNPRLRRRRAVAQLVASGMDDLKKYAAANQPDEFFATLFRLLQEQLGERLDCPASAITESIVDEQLARRALPDIALADLRELFQACNLARYAPSRSSHELSVIVGRFDNAMRELQNLKT